MKSHADQLRYLAESVEEISDTLNPRRKVLLTLLYWKVFDGIDIPKEVMQAILKRGTNPETIVRQLRRFQHIQRELDRTCNEGEETDGNIASQPD